MSNKTIIHMWDKVPGYCEEEPVLEYYPTENKKSDGAIIVFPGGAYVDRAEHEGKGFAEYFNSIGIDAFVLQYRVSPHRFPLELADARRAVRWVRYNAEKYGINPEKIAVIGSSAGGHLATLVSTYREGIEFENIDEIDKINSIPNLQILCYPVVNLSSLKIGHVGSAQNLLGEAHLDLAKTLDAIEIADNKTPHAFIWHTSNDDAVNVCNSLLYGEKLRELEIPFEMHVFPEGYHGLGLAEGKHPGQWTKLLENWLVYEGFYEK